MAAPPIFSGENYHIWAVKMESFMQASDLWDFVETDANPPLPEDPTIAQIRHHKEETMR